MQPQDPNQQNIPPAMPQQPSSMQQPPIQPYQPQPQQQPYGMPKPQPSPKTGLIIGIVAGSLGLLIIIIIVLVLALPKKSNITLPPLQDSTYDQSYSYDSDDLSTSDTNTDNYQSEDRNSRSDDTSTNSNSSSGSTQLNNKVINDTAAGLKIEAQEIRVGTIPMPDRMKDANSHRTIVLVKYKTTKTGSLPIDQRSINLTLADSKNNFSSHATSMLKQELSSAGLTSYETAPVNNGVAEGWKAYLVNKDAASSITLSYRRSSYRIINSGETVPAETATIKLL